MADTATTGLTAITSATTDDVLYIVDAATNSRKITVGDFQASLSIGAINAQTGTSYTLVLTDNGKYITMNNAAANTLTIPTNASVAFDVGAVIMVAQIGAGATTITASTGVTLNGVSAGSGALSAQYAGVSLLKIGTDAWLATNGTLGTVA